MIRIDPEQTITVTIDDEVFTVKTLTARQRMKVAANVTKAAKLFEDEGMSALSNVAELQYEVLNLGIEGDPDLVDPQRWDVLLEAVMKHNQLTEDDSKNSPSP